MTRTIVGQVPIGHPRVYKRERRGNGAEPVETDDILMAQSLPHDRAVIQSLHKLMFGRKRFGGRDYQTYALRSVEVPDAVGTDRLDSDQISVHQPLASA